MCPDERLQSLGKEKKGKGLFSLIFIHQGKGCLFLILTKGLLGYAEPRLQKDQGSENAHVLSTKYVFSALAP